MPQVLHLENNRAGIQNQTIRLQNPCSQPALHDVCCLVSAWLLTRVDGQLQHVPLWAPSSLSLEKASSSSLSQGVFTEDTCSHCCPATSLPCSTCCWKAAWALQGLFRSLGRGKEERGGRGREKQRGQYTQLAGRNMARALRCRPRSEVECLGSAARRPGYLSPCARLITLVRKAT